MSTLCNSVEEGSVVISGKEQRDWWPREWRFLRAGEGARLQRKISLAEGWAVRRSCSCALILGIELGLAGKQARTGAINSMSMGKHCYMRENKALYRVL